LVFAGARDPRLDIYRSAKVLIRVHGEDAERLGAVG
jgi:hypothetical protein